eukprot:358008-Chlamydomonas_euryale.AAC.3
MLTERSLDVVWTPHQRANVAPRPEAPTAARAPLRACARSRRPAVAAAPGWTHSAGRGEGPRCVGPECAWGTMDA